MRNLYRIFLILVLLLIFMAAFLFVTANTQPVTLAVPVADWQYQVTLGALVVVLLALGLSLVLLVRLPAPRPGLVGATALAVLLVLVLDGGAPGRHVAGAHDTGDGGRPPSRILKRREGKGGDHATDADRVLGMAGDTVPSQHALNGVVVRHRIWGCGGRHVPGG